MFTIEPGLQYLLIGNKFEVLANVVSQQPGKRIIPVKDTQDLTPQNIERMALFYMYELVANDLFQLMLTMLMLVYINAPAK